MTELRTFRTFAPATSIAAEIFRRCGGSVTGMRLILLKPQFIHVERRDRESLTDHLDSAKP